MEHLDVPTPDREFKIPKYLQPEVAVQQLSAIFARSREKHQAAIDTNPKLKARVELLEVVLPVIPQAAHELGRLLRLAFLGSEFQLGKIRVYLVGSRVREDASFNLKTDFDLLITVEGQLPWQGNDTNPDALLERSRFLGWAKDRLRYMKINEPGKRSVINEENIRSLQVHNTFSARADSPAILLYEESETITS